MARKVYLAVDLGAESGRVMAGLWNGKKLGLEELHRFPNGPVPLAGSLRWDVPRLWSEIQAGLAKAAKRFGKDIVSVGADTWGVDYALLSKSEEMLGQPFHYRDARTNGIMEHAFKIVSREKIFEQTGLQFMQFNTLFQLLAAKARSPEILDAADTLLFMPDLIHWALCGSKAAEFTIASTSQCLHPETREWSTGLLEKLGLPTAIFPKIVAPGTNLGVIRPQVREVTGLGHVQVITPPSHDTASAVAAVPTELTGSPKWAYISSGTWSLMGLEVARASLYDRTLQYNLTNEGGLDGTYRLLKNIMGLWLVQRCKKAFEAAGRQYDYAELVKLASEARPLRSLVNPDDPRFLNPPDMPTAIRDFCRETGQPVPKSHGELARCAYESLALRYREVLGWLEELGGEKVQVIHIVGGGSQNQLLNQFTADACQRPVVAGPVEATALGNLLVQARADGELSSLSDMREFVRRSSSVKVFKPSSSQADWPSLPRVSAA